MKRLAHLISPLLAIAVFSAGSWALYRELRNYHWLVFRQSLQEISFNRVAWAVLLTVLDYTILVANDLLASLFVGRRIPLAKLAMGSVAGYAASHNLGAAFGGAAVRYRFYASWGLSASEIAIWIGMLTTSFVVGASAVGGAACVVHPMAPLENLHWPLTSIRPVGFLLLVLPASYLVLCAIYRSPVRWRNWNFRLPSSRIAALQVFVGSADLCCAAGILYVLLPQSASITYLQFLIVYLLAAVPSVCSHVPGAVGVFDLVTIKMLEHADPHGTLAALLVYRVAYYLLPLAVGLLLFTAHEVQTKKSESSSGAGQGRAGGADGLLRFNGYNADDSSRDLPMHNSPSTAGLPPLPATPPIRWSARARAVVSIVVVLHILAILVGPLSVPPTILGGFLGSFFRPYLQAAYLGNAYKFFGPDPEASHLVRYDVELADGSHVEGTLPDRKQHWPRLLYHRYFMLSEFLMKLDASARPDLPWEKQPLAPLAVVYWRSYGQHLLRQHRARRVTLYLVEHELPMPGQVREGMRLDDPRLYHTRKLGAIEGDAG